MDQQDLRVFKDLLDHKVFKVKLDQQDLKDQQVKEDLKVNVAPVQTNKSPLTK